MRAATSRLRRAGRALRAAYLRKRIGWAEDELAAINPLDINPLQLIHARVHIARLRRELELLTTQHGTAQ